MADNISTVVATYLWLNGYDGLYHPDGECACEAGDLMPCGGPSPGCAGGYKHVITEEQKNGYEIGDWFISPTKEMPPEEEWPEI